MLSTILLIVNIHRDIVPCEIIQQQVLQPQAEVLVFTINSY